MTTLANRTTPTPTTKIVAPTSKGRLFIKIITTTDHKMIGYMYLVTTFAWFLIGGLLALILRAELARPACYRQHVCACHMGHAGEVHL